MKIPLLSDLTHQISKDYGVYLEDQGHTLRWGFPSTQVAFLSEEIILKKLFIWGGIKRRLEKKLLD